MCALGWTVLGELGQEIQRREDLEIPLGAGGQLVALRIGEGPAGIFLSLVDDLPGLGHPQPSGFRYLSAISAGFWKISAVASRGLTLENRALPSRRKHGAGSDIPGYHSWADRASHVERLSLEDDLIHPDATPRLQPTSSKQRLHAGRSQKSAAQGRPDKKGSVFGGRARKGPDRPVAVTGTCQPI